ncbi:MAG: hypothetical protein JNJ48_01845 [Phycisphaerae bacterium]|nr:hypothetical protein [Phycisphaerae bacterium]
MGCEFNRTDLFGPGPQRAALEPFGLLAPARLSIGQTAPGSVVLGPLELTVIVRGRMVTAGDADLADRLQFIADQLTDPPSIGELVLDDGRAFADMAFLRFSPADRTDRARAVSLAFEARFTRLLTP